MECVETVVATKSTDPKLADGIHNRICVGLALQQPFTEKSVCAYPFASVFAMTLKTCPPPCLTVQFMDTSGTPAPAAVVARQPEVWLIRNSPGQLTRYRKLSIAFELLLEVLRTRGKRVGVRA